MQMQDDPIKRLRTALGLNQKPFGALFGAKQASVSEWEGGAPLSIENASALWEQYGARLRGMGCRFQDLLVRRSPKRSRRSGEGEGRAA